MRNIFKGLFVVMSCLFTINSFAAVIFESDLVQTGNGFTAAGQGSFSTSAVSWASAYSNYWKTGSSTHKTTLTFSPALDISGSSNVQMTVYWGHTSANKNIRIYVNNSEITSLVSGDKTTAAANTLYQAVVAISGTSINTIAFQGQGSSGLHVFHFTIEGDGGSATPTVSNVTVTPPSATLEINGTQQLTATVTASPASADKTVTWSTSDANVAKVSESGLVTAVAQGTATITATSNLDNTQKGTCAITVNPPASPIPVTAISVDATATIGIGESKTLTVTYTPSNANEGKAVSWSSANPNTATVDANGVVTGVAAGNVSITATSTTNPSITASCNVTVQKIAVTGVNLNKTSTSLQIGQNETLTATVLPANATNKGVTWSSSAPGFASVDQTGKVTAVAAGSATITAASAEDNTKTATCAVTVTAAPPVPESGLTKHVPDIYDAKTVAGGYGGKLTVDGGREFEVYYASRTSDSKASILVEPGDKKTGIEDQATASATHAKAADGWVEANINSISGGTSAKASAFGEFKELYDEWRVGGNSVKMDIEGFDMFSYYAADKSTEIDSKTGTYKKEQRFQVFIDGVMQPETQCNTNATVRRYEISAGRHVIEVKGMSGGDSKFYAFSLRVSDNPRTRYIKGNDSTQVILQTQSPKPVYYFTKYNSKGETKLEWEGNEATGIKLDVKGSTTIGDTLVLSGEANCPVGDYKYHVVTYMNGAETSRASGKFSVTSDIKAISDTIVDAYQQEEMEAIVFRYYALDASAITLTWKNGNAPAGLTTSDDKTKHTFTIGGTTTSAPGKYYYTVTIAGSSTVITGYIEVISQDLGVNPVLYLYQTKSPRRAYEDDGIYAYLKSKGVNLQPRTAIKKLRSAEQYAKFKWILISEDVDADNEEVLAIVKGSDKGGVGLPVLNLKGFTYTPDRLAWGEPDNGSIDTVSNNGCNIYIERADHPIFESFKLKHGAKLQIFNKLQQNGVMPINIDLPGTLCLATAYTRNIEDYYKDGELQTVIHEIPAAMRGGKKYICVPLSMSSSKDLSADGKALFNAIVTYLTDPKEYTITRPTLQINSFSVNKLAATINGDRIDLVYDSIQHPDMNIAALAPEIVLEDEMTHVVPAPGVPMDFTYSLYMPVPYVVTDYINRRVYDVVIQAYGGQGLEETGYTAGEWVNIYDIYGRMITTTNENIYTMPLPHGIYIAVTAEGKSIKVMR